MGVARSAQGKVAIVLCCVAMAGFGQQPSLTLREAIDRALGQNPEIQVALANAKAAHAGVSMTRTGLLPHFNLTEDISCGNDPAFVFGTELRQQQFMQSDFSLDSLNRPASTAATRRQIVFSWRFCSTHGSRSIINRSTASRGSGCAKYLRSAST